MAQQHHIPQPTLPDPFKQPKKRAWLPHLWIVLGGAAILGVAVLALNWPQAGTPPTTSHTVLYEAEASGASGPRTGSSTMQTDSGGSSQGQVPLPATQTLHNFSSGDFVYLSVQNQDAAGAVTCRITVDGVVVSENTSTGGYVIATCQGRVP